MAKPAAERTTFTYTYYIRHLVGGGSFYCATEEAANSSTYGVTERVEPVSRTYSLGQAVLVRAFGRPRAGTVTKLGRTTVTVTYSRNQQGDQHTRTFSPAEFEDTP